MLKLYLQIISQTILLILTDTACIIFSQHLLCKRQIDWVHGFLAEQICFHHSRFAVANAALVRIFGLLSSSGLWQCFRWFVRSVWVSISCSAPPSANVMLWVLISHHMQIILCHLRTSSTHTTNCSNHKVANISCDGHNFAQTS